MAKILLLDDDPQIRRAVELYLEKEGHEVFSCEDGREGIDCLEQEDFDLIITDLKMPDFSGMDLLEFIKKSKISIPVIVLTGFATIESAVEAMKIGAADYITKPPQLAEISLKIEKILSREKILKENERLQNQLNEKFKFDGIIGQSPSMRKMFERLKPLAKDGEISIYLWGESGTGKELIAKAVHYNSPRKKEPFVAINCGALPEHLLESELFGHEKGAFTDAKKLKKGLFEAADKGTIFLDEIASMPLSMQVKLLRAIEEKKIRRVGGTEEIPLDLRFVSASNQNLQKLAREEKFREDLYYRLAVAVVEIPPLRERAGDIRLLAQNFLNDCNKLKGKSLKFEPEVLDILEKNVWRGNVRELQNLIELLVVTTDGKKIKRSNLPRRVRDFSKNKEFSVENDGEKNNLKKASKKLVEQFEHEFIFSELEKNHWNITKTAESLGVSRSSLHSKMKNYGLDKK